MQRSFKELIDELKERCNIVDVVSSYLPLKRSGRYYKTRCPFHPDKNPSFTVSEEKGVWHCFGCGAGGDVFSFLMRIENITFVEAAKLLAEREGIPFQWEGKADESRDRIASLYEACAKFWNGILFQEEGKEALEYLLSRGVKKETIEEFLLGFAPSSTEVFRNFLRKQGVSEEDLQNSGLFSQGREGLYLLFAGRIIFPIFSPTGKVIAFGGRAMGEAQPKYINSPETALFKKGQVLYAFHLAKDYIKKEGKVILVEGYMDAISLHQVGLRNSVATMGTALTEEHLRLLKRYTDSIYLSFDADSPGLNATLRVAPLAKDMEMEVFVVRLPPAYDPDQLVQEKGRAGMEDALENAIDIYDFQIERLLSADVEGDKKKWREELERLITMLEIRNPLLKEETIRRINEGIRSLAERLEIRKGTLPSPFSFYESAIRSALALKSSQITAKEKGRGAIPLMEKTDQHISPEGKAERELLRCLLEEPSLFHIVKGSLTEEHFSFPLHKEIYRVIQELHRQGNFSLALLLDALEEEEKAYVSSLILEEVPPPSQRVVEDCLKKILDANQRRLIGQMEREVLKLIKEGKLHPNDPLYQEYMKLRRSRTTKRSD